MSQLYSDPYITNVLLKKAEERFPFDTGNSVRPSKHLECVCCLLQDSKVGGRGKERKYDSWCQAIIATWKEHVDEDDYLSACLLSEVSVSEFKMRTLTLPQPPPQLPLLDFSFLCLLSLIWRIP